MIGTAINPLSIAIRTAVKKIIDGKRAITADMALRFGLFFDMSASFWLNISLTFFEKGHPLQAFEVTV